MATTSQFFGGPRTVDFYSTSPVNLVPSAPSTALVNLVGGASMLVVPIFGPIGKPVLMILEGGPLDGEEQLVEMVPTTAGSVLLFNLPNFQTFDPDTENETVTALGLQATYAFVQRGRDPQPTDNWSSSWIFDFAGESYVPVPPPLPPPGPSMPVDIGQIAMIANTTLVPDRLPIITSPVLTMTVESVLNVDLELTRGQAGVVAMGGMSVLSVTPDWTPKVEMSANAQMGVTHS